MGTASGATRSSSFTFRILTLLGLIAVGSAQNDSGGNSSNDTVNGTADDDSASGTNVSDGTTGDSCGDDSTATTASGAAPKFSSGMACFVASLVTSTAASRSIKRM